MKQRSCKNWFAEVGATKSSLSTPSAEAKQAAQAKAAAYRITIRIP